MTVRKGLKMEASKRVVDIDFDGLNILYEKEKVFAHVSDRPN